MCKIIEPSSMRACPKQNQDFVKEHNRTTLIVHEQRTNRPIRWTATCDNLLHRRKIPGWSTALGQILKCASDGHFNFPRGNGEESSFTNMAEDRDTAVFKCKYNKAVICVSI